jgi:phosphatidate phosphatase PAH1
LDLKSFINQKGNNDIKIFIDEEHKIFNKEIYLFDHPEFGILFSINKI